jgi:hypothetical protein
MPSIIHNMPFELSTNRESRTAAIKITAGSAKLQCCIGRDGATWVDVPNSSVTADTVYTFHQSRGLLYRWVLTGDAVGYMSD